MKCEIAKNNPLLMDEAIKHYLYKKRLFTFKSLWNDEEPYPKDELIQCLAVRIEKVKALMAILPTIGNELTLKRLENVYKQLTKQP